MFGLLFKKKIDIGKEEVKIESLHSLKQKYKKEQQKNLTTQERKQRLKKYLERAGIEISTKKLFAIFFNIAIGVNIIISAYLIYYFSSNYGITWTAVAVSMVFLWVFVFILLIFLLWIFFYVAVDLKIFKRKVDIEDVLPDFLQLTASNIKAGMTIDKALWFAVRPKFGVLAKEIELVAKETMSGVDLNEALQKFASRYDSMMLKRTINMLNEGISAGGEIGDLLDRIAIDIQEQKSLNKEMSANVTTYVIFISFATMFAAPLLFALSGVLISVVQNLASTLGEATIGASTGIPITFSGTGISQSDFRIFATVSIIISSFFSAIMVSTIKRGNAKYGVKFIPVFIMVPLLIYFVAQNLSTRLISVFF